jgi:long-chain acyl-CoA synthetase
MKKHYDDRDIPELFRQTARAYSNHAAIRYADREVKFHTLDALSDRVSAALSDMNVGKGDRVGLYGVNSDTFIISYLGIIKSGATVVPINVLMNPKEVSWILNDAEAGVLLYDGLFADAVDTFSETVPGLREKIQIGGSREHDGVHTWEEFLENTLPVPSPGFNTAEDVVAILYTSGTTGKPKGAMLTHRNLAANTASVFQAMKLQPCGDTFLVVLPLFHSFAATAGMLTPLLYGSAISPLPRFEPATVTDTIEAVEATIFLGVPSMYTLLLRLPDDAIAKLSTLRFCVSGGSAMPVEVLQQFEEKFGKLIYEGDGPTECSPVTCVNPIDEERRIGSVGLPVPGVKMSIRDDDMKELENGEIGEICCTGDSMMKGYWNRPEETQDVFHGVWLKTGDLGYRDDDGYIYIVDRKKDMIIVNGMNVYPSVIEEVLYTHPAIREAAVVGEPDRLHGEVPVAFLSLNKGQSLDAAAAKKHCAESLGRHEIPKKFNFLDELPKNATGKILKRELRVAGEIERGIDSR